MSLQVQETHQAEHANASSSSSTSSSATQSYDLVVVGFGTAALSLATALADSESDLKVLFLESKSKFNWAPASVLPENAVRTSFLRDLITTRNPRSEFTFVNYLFESNQLVQFTNSSHMTPTRLVMGNYLSWVAAKMVERSWVRYSSTATRLTPVKDYSSQISGWNINVHDAQGHNTIITSKRVVLATGSKPRIPAALASASGGQVLHTSQVAGLLHNLKDQDIAIVGADQEAAEIFEHLQSAGAQHRVRATMFIPDSALRPEDNTSFTQDIVDDCLPGVSSSSIPPELRPRLSSSQSTSPGPKISLHTIEALYENLYAQRVLTPNPSSWRFNIIPLSTVTATTSEAQNKLRLSLQNPRTGEIKQSDTVFDVVIAAGGYTRSTPLLADIESAGVLQEGKVTVDAEYRVSFRKNAVARDTGLWVLGSLEQGELRDEEMGFAVERGARLLESVVECVGNGDENSRGEVAML